MKSKASFPDLTAAQNAEIDRARKLGWKVDIGASSSALQMSTRVLKAAREYLKTVQTEPPTLPLPSGPDGWPNAVILYCGHSATFVADIIVTPHAVTVIGKVRGSKLNPIGLEYGAAAVAKAAWHISDEFPGTYWNPANGRFVLPRKAVTKLK